MMWLIIWIIFLIMSIIERKGVVFGFFAGIYAMFLGIYIYLDGIQVQSGLNTSWVEGTQIVDRVYVNAVPSFSSYGMLFGVPFMLVGVYICYLSANKNR